MLRGTGLGGIRACGPDPLVTINNFYMSEALIKKGQIWRNKNNGKQFKIISKAKGGRWKAVELSSRTDFYLSTHSFLPFIIRQKFELLT